MTDTSPSPSSPCSVKVAVTLSARSFTSVKETNEMEASIFLAMAPRIAYNTTRGGAVFLKDLLCT